MSPRAADGCAVLLLLLRSCSIESPGNRKVGSSPARPLAESVVQGKPIASSEEFPELPSLRRPSPTLSEIQAQNQALSSHGRLDREDLVKRANSSR